MTIETVQLLACRECDALLKVPRGIRALNCPRCGYAVVRATEGRSEGALAFYVASGIFFAIANALPIVSIEAAGNKIDTTLVGAAWALHAQGMSLIGLIVLVTTVIVPVLELACTLALLLISQSPRSSRWRGYCLRVREKLRPWSMIEIFLLGALVAIVKLGGLASVVIGTGIWSLGAFMVTSAAGFHLFNQAGLWRDSEPIS